MYRGAPCWLVCLLQPSLCSCFNTVKTSKLDLKLPPPYFKRMVIHKLCVVFNLERSLDLLKSYNNHFGLQLK